MKKQTNYQKGLIAEDYIAAFLQSNGFTILAKRYKTVYGEIDLIAQKKKKYSL